MIRGTALLIALLLPTVAGAQETWVAVANDGGGNFGYAVGMATREAAEMTALGECGGGCAIRLAAPARCVAYAHSPAGATSGYGAGATREAVEQSAWAECNRRVPSDSCTVRLARCFQ